MLTTLITHVPVNAICGARPRIPRQFGPKCDGVMFPVAVSRLEAGLGHQTYQCDRCGRQVKHVPRDPGR